MKCNLHYRKMTPIPGNTMVISQNRPYNAFPKVIRITHPKSTINNTILAAWYSGNNHVDTNSDGWIMGVISTDNAQSWTPPFLIYDDKTLDCRNIGLVCAPNGTVILFFAKVDVSKIRNKRVAWQDFGFIKSYNGGHTWTEYNSLLNQADFRNHQITSGNGYGDPVIIDNSIYLLCYGFTPENAQETHMSFLICSKDNGESWEFKNTLALGSGISFSEADFWSDHGLLFGFSRTEDKPFRYLHYFESSDVGQSWSVISPTNIQGDCPEIIRLSDGRYLVAIRSYSSYGFHPTNFVFLGYFCLPSDFTNRTDKVSLYKHLNLKCLAKPKFGTKRGDLAYPSIILLGEGQILVIYYDISNGGIIAKTVKESNL